MSAAEAELEGRVALVTGATRGIGRAVAALLAARGARVAVTGRSPEDAEAAAAGLPGAGLGIGLEVSDPESVAACVSAVVAAWGRLDVLVNNAGITRDNLALRMKLEDWRAVLDANLTGAFLCTKECLRHMVKARRGTVVNVSSVVGGLGNPGQANYCASKAGLEGMTRSLAREYANRGIRVNAVAPGFIETDMTEALGEKAREALLNQVPLGRLGSPGDVAEAVAFLVSDRSTYITGHVLHVNGGMYMG
ncbi:MAG: 3-oxoacyl-ACP reductase FabG [Deferrisomatales bacterium]